MSVLSLKYHRWTRYQMAVNMQVTAGIEDCVSTGYSFDSRLYFVCGKQFPFISPLHSN